MNGAQGAGAPAPEGIGEALRRARAAHGLSLYALAFDLNLHVRLLEAIEAEDWERLPPGRERPYVRQVAERLGVDLDAFSDQWGQLPGGLDQEPPDPRREHLERLLMGALSAGTVLLVLWLVVPGRSLRQPKAARPEAEAAATPLHWKPTEPSSPFPVLGEVLPEVPVNEDGVLVSMRCLDTCEASIVRDQDPGSPQKRTLRVSEPWRLRVKGPFAITLDNGGVVVLDVAGRRIRFGAAVGEPWTGRFGENGEYLVPEAPAERYPPTAPESDSTDREGE